MIVEEVVIKALVKKNLLVFAFEVIKFSKDLLTLDIVEVLCFADILFSTMKKSEVEKVLTKGIA